MTNISEKSLHEKVYELLEKHYKYIPNFEKNPLTFNILHTILTQIERVEEFDQEREKVRRIQDNEYVSESKRINQLLENLGIQMSSLSEESQKELKTLSAITTQLNIKDNNLSSFQTALIQLQSEDVRLNGILRQQNSALDQLEARSHSLHRIIHNLQGLLDKVKEKKPQENFKMKEWRQNSTLLSIKSKEYHSRLDTLEQQYKNLSIERLGLNYEQMSRLKTELLDLRGEIEQKQSKLTQFKQLPPDIELAKVKVAELKAKLRQIQEERERLLNDMVEHI